MLPKCKNCGVVGVYVNGMAQGKVKVYFNEEGRELEVDTDSLYFECSHVVRCEGCGKIRRDLIRKKGRIIELQQEDK